MNPWFMGLLAAAVSALAGASATSWWEAELQVPEVGAEVVVEDDALDPEHGELARPWLERRPEPELHVVHPLAAVEDEELERLVAEDALALGSMSVGSPGRGALVNGRLFPESPLWKLVDPEHAWGTEESIEFTAHAIRRVNEQFPDSPPLFVGDFSAQRGGRLEPHKSHQSGRDVDLGYYYIGEQVWYRRATAANLDRARTWALLEALITETRVQYIFIDRSIQPLLEEYALAHGEDPQWLARVFRGAPGRKDSIVRHRWGHATHLHVRFENPTAELTARRAYPFLQKAGLLARAGYYGEPRLRARRRR